MNMTLTSKTVASRVSGWLERAFAFNLNSDRVWKNSRIFVPLLFGCYSLWLGQDQNGDQFNYHLYNAFAFLNGKLDIDLAPAGMQSYFNPLLDVATYFLYTHFPAPIVGFGLGVLHGLSFLLVLEIARLVLVDLNDADRYKIPLLLAAAGCLTANFLSGLGNTMGDDTTALLLLCAVALVLRSWGELGKASLISVSVSLAAGALAGAGAGLKLTNAVYAVALCVACLAYPGSVRTRIRIAFLVGVGVLLGLAATGGFWFLKMWDTFHNPVFPQFSNLFPNDLVPRMTVADLRWFPKNWVETALWPFIFSLNSQRVGEINIHQIIWAVLYGSVICWLPVAVWRCRNGGRFDRLRSKQVFVLLFVVTGYGVWLKVFSVYRYVVAIEMLAPLVLYTILVDLLPFERRKLIAGTVIGAATFVVIFGGVGNWGHARWAWKAFEADIPAISEPDRTTVLIVGADSARGWLATFFPPSVAFTKIAQNFEVTPAYDERVKAMIARRGGPTYAVIQGFNNSRLDSLVKAQYFVQGLGLTQSSRGCTAIRQLVERLHLHATVQSNVDGTCQLALRPDDVQDIKAQNVAEAIRVNHILHAHGFSLLPSKCEPYDARLGQAFFGYQWCPVERMSER
ncbi:hypothetical protein [Paraburkholderia gardini]